MVYTPKEYSPPQKQGLRAYENFFNTKVILFINRMFCNLMMQISFNGHIIAVPGNGKQADNGVSYVMSKLCVLHYMRMRRSRFRANENIIISLLSILLLIKKSYCKYIIKYGIYSNCYVNDK